MLFRVLISSRVMQDAGSGIAAFHAGAGDLLPDVVARQAHDHLEDLDVEFSFRLADGGPQGAGRALGVEDVAVADTV